MPPARDDPPSFTGANTEPAPAGADQQQSGMMDLISGLQKERDAETSGDTATSGSTGRDKKKKKKAKKKKTKIKRKRRKDRYESQNYLLRIEGTLCCASIIVAIIWLVSLFAVMLICGIWSNFDFTATTDSVKGK